MACRRRPHRALGAGHDRPVPARPQPHPGRHRDHGDRARPADDFILLRPRDGIGPNLSLDRVRSAVQVPPRIHLDLYTEDQAGEVKRLLALGATEIHWDKRPPDADYVILADPEGNRFCVVDINRP